jgi:hypothetical protein
MPDLGGILGEKVDRAIARLGPPAADRSVGGGRWLVFETLPGTLRARAAAASPRGDARIESWTLSFGAPFADIDRTAAALGLDPEPPTPEDLDVDGPLARRGLRTGDTLASLTAAGAPGAFRSLTAFDEAPDWRTDAPS